MSLKSNSKRIVKPAKSQQVKKASTKRSQQPETKSSKTSYERASSIKFLELISMHDSEMEFSTRVTLSPEPLLDVELRARIFLVLAQMVKISPNTLTLERNFKVFLSLDLLTFLLQLIRPQQKSGSFTELSQMYREMIAELSRSKKQSLQGYRVMLP